jgi:DNA (cytosine-5)-methyltransferase 1
MDKPRALDMFCCAGGTAAGLIEAGFEVWGVDIDPRCERFYPGHFICDDVFKLASRVELDGSRFLERYFDFIWASPKCQHFSAMTRIRGKAENHPNQIPATRELLDKLGRAYVIENVPEARQCMRVDLELCGLMFGRRLYRHRIFEIHGFPTVQPRHVEHAGQQEFSVVGRLVSTKRNGGPERYQRMKAAWPEAMGITHIPLNVNTTDGQNMFSQAVPPCFAKYIAEQFLAWRSKA